MTQFSHAYIISSPDSDAAYSEALRIAKSVVGTEKNVHPDIIEISAEDGKKGITVDQVRTVVTDSFILPNQSEKKVYIFRDGGLMNAAAQNAALKLLEEPPESVIIILCAVSPDRFLPTVRSRCVELTAKAGASDDVEDSDGASYKLAERYLSTLASGDELALFFFCEESNGISPAETRQFVDAALTLLADIACKRNASIQLETAQILEIEKLLKKCIRYLDVNVNVKQIFGLLMVSHF